MRSLLKDKRGFIPLAGLSVGALIVVAIAVILIVAGIFVFTTINKFAIVGGGMVALALIFGLRGELNKTKAWFLGIVIVLGLVFMFMGNTLQSTYGATTVLSISDVTIEGSQAKIRATVVAGGSEDITIKFTKEQLNSFLNDEGYSASQDITGSIRYLTQSKNFDIQFINKAFYKADVTEKSEGVFCNSDNCQASVEKLNSQAITIAQARPYGFFGDCNCVYIYPFANYGEFTRTGDLNSRVSFNIGSFSQTVDLSSSTSSISLGGNNKIQWTGDLTNNRFVETPDQYLAYYENGAYKKLIGKDAPSKQESAYEVMTSSLGNRKFLQDGVGAVEYILDGQSRSDLESITTAFNNELTNALENKNSEYETTNSKYIDSVSFQSNQLIVDLSSPLSYPVFTITLDAESVGIKPLYGDPDIVNCVDNFDFDSGDSDTQTISVKNVGSSEGLFKGSLSCSGDIAGSVQQKMVGAGETTTMKVTLTGSNTGSGTLSSSCKITIFDNEDSSKKDTCNFGVKVQPRENIVCNANSKVCISSKVLRVCSSDGKSYNDVTCENQCLAVDGDDYCSSGEETPEPSQGLECAWYEYETTAIENDYGLFYWRAWTFVGPEKVPVAVCKTKDWIKWAGLGAIIVFLGSLAIIVNRPKRGKKRK